VSQSRVAIIVVVRAVFKCPIICLDSLRTNAEKTTTKYGMCLVGERIAATERVLESSAALKAAAQGVSDAQGELDEAEVVENTCALSHWICTNF
jgi:hypothetical protein